MTGSPVILQRGSSEPRRPCRPAARQGTSQAGQCCGQGEGRPPPLPWPLPRGQPKRARPFLGPRSVSKQGRQGGQGRRPWGDLEAAGHGLVTPGALRGWGGGVPIGPLTPTSAEAGVPLRHPCHCHTQSSRGWMLAVPWPERAGESGRAASSWKHVDSSERPPRPRRASVCTHRRGERRWLCCPMQSPSFHRVRGGGHVSGPRRASGHPHQSRQRTDTPGYPPEGPGHESSSWGLLPWQWAQQGPPWSSGSRPRTLGCRPLCEVGQ